jgi:pilus assembly protein CpaF
MTLHNRPPDHAGAAAPRTGHPPRSRVGEASAGLVQRVQRRLAANGAVASDAASLRAAVAEALGEDGVQLPAANLDALVRAIGDELTGLGPLAPLLADPAVTDVLVNGPAEVWVERGGAIERAGVRFPSAAAVAALVQRVVAPLGLRVDESRPWVDARLPGGERFHAVLPPLAPDGPVVTIRTFARRRLHLGDLIEGDALDAATARLLEAMVAAGIAIAVSGATGTGKTTLLNVLADAIPARERVVTIEDVAELRLPGPHVVRLEARPPNVEGRGEVPLRELVRNALRMRPDRIVVGEVRGPEVLDMLQAANTGHHGLMTTLHAGSPDEVPARLEAMALAAPGAGLDVVRRLVGGGIGAVVHLEPRPGRPTRAPGRRGRRTGHHRRRPLPGHPPPHRRSHPRPVRHRPRPPLGQPPRPRRPPRLRASPPRRPGPRPLPTEPFPMRVPGRAPPVGRGSPTQLSPWGRAARRRVPPWGRVTRKRSRRASSLGRSPSLRRARLGGRPAGLGSIRGPGAPSGGRRGRRERPAGWTRQPGAGRRGRSDRPARRLARLLRRAPRPGRAAVARRRMESAVPEVIDVLRATVAAGINPRRALQAAAEGAPPALEAVLGQAIRAAELGSGAGHALATVARGEGLTELALAGEALDLAETTGAPPGPVLAGVATAAADRVRTRQARMAATAQARLSARVVAAMAPVFLAILALTSPTDAAFLLREPPGWAALTTAIAFELLGIGWSARIVRGPAP